MSDKNKIEIEDQDVPVMNNGELKVAIEEQLSKIRSQSMMTGFKVACSTIKNKIDAFEMSSGAKSNNDHKRLIKDIKKFVEQALARKTDEDGESETAQN